MISYTLKCEAGHSFDSWFQSAAAFDKLVAARQVVCVECGSHEVSKAVMAPRLAKAGAQKDETAPDTAPMLGTPSSEVQQALAELRRKVEAHSEYVGDRFAHEARAMHLGEKPERSIYGEARLDQARSLIEDGVPLVPLPFRPKRKLS
ncbi:hypothetical protein FIU94_10000 [Sulfitobacter sp. THAF37]|uniref:DUF1178 family protein n=1 Tax=Sulfitobacter sp. THAF37 TaxID=2587855 RepID=UPI00126922B9|nr:DUF1178 family protein [Sulfitobacter sp. THAF37]QFT59157.1 hypothetical protein FIU94_10000 [Sulfitobacter sp. THAF37]